MTEQTSRRDFLGKISLVQNTKFWMAIIFSIALIFNLIALGAFGLYDPSEGFYAEGAREMIESGDLLVPHLNYLPWFEKPILIYWLIALSYKVFGVTEFASRIPSAICASLLVAWIFYATIFFMRRRGAFLASAILMSSPLFLVLGHLALTDMVFSFFTSVAMLSFFLGAEAGQTSFNSPGYVALALALLCKGPIAIALIAFTFGTYFLVSRKPAADVIQSIKSLLRWQDLLLLIAVALPWYVAVHIATGGRFTNQFFLEQNLGRLAHLSSFESHTSPWWFYIPVLAVGFSPWTLFLLGFQISFGKRNFFGGNKHRKLLIFSACWSACTFVLFSCATSKLPTYILPALPGLAILTGASFDLLSRIRRPNSLIIIFGVLSALLTTLSLPIAWKLLGVGQLDAAVLVLIVLVIIAAIAQLVYAFLLSLNRTKRAVAVLVCTLVLVMGTIIPQGLIVHYHHFQSSLPEILHHIPTRSDPVASLFREPTVAVFYLRRRIQVIENPLALESWLAIHRRENCYLLSPQDIEKALTTKYKDTHLVARGYRWYLYSIRVTGS